MDNEEDLIKLIDNRLNKPVSVYGTVKKFDYETNRAMVLLAGSSSAQSFTNRSGEWLSIGDTVEAEFSAWENRIVKRFGVPAPFGQVFVMTQAEYDSLTEKKENCLYGIIQEEQ